MKRIAVLGSTGSIGKQTLEVVSFHPDRFKVTVLACHSSIDILKKQADRFQPELIVITDKAAGSAFRSMYNGSARVLIGQGALASAATLDAVDLVVVAVVGIAGLSPTLAAMEAGKEVALANKETLVAGGALVMKAARDNHCMIRPVDSEHSAIFQSMMGQDRKHIHALLLTASGGPFRGKTKEELRHVTLEDAMKHPTWTMGRKVTLDSATMFNKGLEVIEAHWLFDVPYDRIQVIIQPQSLIHSMVEYDDGSVMAQIGNPDMRLPIQFALTYPERLETPGHDYVDWKSISSIQMEMPDYSIFRSLPMAFEAGKAGGDTACAFNASNEEAISAFIDRQIGFLTIYDVVDAVLSGWDTRPISNLEDVMNADRKARRLAEEAIRGVSQW